MLDVRSARATLAGQALIFSLHSPARSLKPFFQDELNDECTTPRSLGHCVPFCLFFLQQTTEKKKKRFAQGWQNAGMQWDKYSAMDFCPDQLAIAVGCVVLIHNFTIIDHTLVNNTSNYDLVTNHAKGLSAQYVYINHSMQ